MIVAFHCEHERAEQFILRTIRKLPGHQTESRRRADRRRGIILLELQTILRERIDVRRFDFAAVRTEVVDAEVVGEDEEDVGFGGCIA